MLLCISRRKVKEQAGRWLQALSQLSECAVDSLVILWRLRLLNSFMWIPIKTCGLDLTEKVTIEVTLLTTLINNIWSLKISPYKLLLSEVEFYFMNLQILYMTYTFFNRMPILFAYS